MKSPSFLIVFDRGCVLLAHFFDGVQKLVLEIAAAAGFLQLPVDGSVFQEDNPVAEGGGEAVMGHHENGSIHLFLGVFEGINDGAAGLTVQISCGLVLITGITNHKKIKRMFLSLSTRISFMTDRQKRRFSALENVP